MNNLQIIEHEKIRVLTTPQLAECYNCDRKTISYNFRYNKNRYVEGKHYIELKGDELRQFKNRLENHDGLKRATVIYLWTEKGALLHAKSLNTDKAWEVYDYLVDFYFRAKEEVLLPDSGSKAPELPPSLPAVPPAKGAAKCNIPEMTNPILILHVLLDLASDCGMTVASFDFKSMRSALHNDRIGIRSNFTVEETVYELAFELAHAIVHHGYGDMIKSPLAKEYNQHAERIAEFVIRALNIKMRHMM